MASSDGDDLVTVANLQETSWPKSQLDARFELETKIMEKVVIQKAESSMRSSSEPQTREECEVDHKIR